MPVSKIATIEPGLSALYFNSKYVFLFAGICVDSVQKAPAREDWLKLTPVKEPSINGHQEVVALLEKP